MHAAPDAGSAPTTSWQPKPVREAILRADRMALMSQPAVVQSPRPPVSADQPDDEAPFHDVSARAQIGRVALFVLGYIVVLWVTAIAKGMVPPAIGDLTWGALASVGIIGLTWVMRRRQGAAQREKGRTAVRVRQLLGGGVIGLSTYALTLAAIGLLIAPLTVSLTVVPDPLTAVLTVAGYLALACMEELGFRGYPLQTLSAAWGTRPALLVVSLLFRPRTFSSAGLGRRSSSASCPVGCSSELPPWSVVGSSCRSGCTQR